MRVLMVRPGPGFSVADVYRGWLHALTRLGVQTIDFNLDDRLSFYQRSGTMKADGFVRMVDDAGAVRLASKGVLAACYELKPDVVLIVSCFYIPVDALDLIRSHGTKVVILHTEEPYEHDRQLVRGEHADLNLLNDPTHLDKWRTVGAAEYMPHAYDPGIHYRRPARADYRSDFAFVGTGYPGRVDFFEQVDWTGIDVALGGNWQHMSPLSPLYKFLAHDADACLDNANAVELYSSTKISANIYRGALESERPELGEGWACGPREIELAAVGVPFLRERRGEGDEVFKWHPTFETPEEFAAKLRSLLRRPNELETIAYHGRRAVEGRTFDANAKRFLSLLERL